MGSSHHRLLPIVIHANTLSIPFLWYAYRNCGWQRAINDHGFQKFNYFTYRFKKLLQRRDLPPLKPQTACASNVLLIFPAQTDNRISMFGCLVLPIVWSWRQRLPLIRCFEHIANRSYGIKIRSCFVRLAGIPAVCTLGGNGLGQTVRIYR